MYMTINFWGTEFKINVIVGCIGAFLIAVFSSMLGFGGGPFMVPLMAVVLGLPMYVVVGSSLLAIFFNTSMATFKHYSLGNFDLDLFLVMFPAALLAGWLGPKIAKRLNPLWVKRVAVVGLTLLGLSLVGLF
ncbi:MAG: sulfite exporter TauE/SafE family protein [Rhodocyclaceae bacterium]|nr:sulfite exporter TauE/SafE family protein [Rhodocyclaceae bacterium]